MYYSIGVFGFYYSVCNSTGIFRMHRITIQALSCYICRCLVFSRTRTPLFLSTWKEKEKERRQESRGKRWETCFNNLFDCFLFVDFGFSVLICPSRALSLALGTHFLWIYSGLDKTLCDFWPLTPSYSLCLSVSKREGEIHRSVL